MTQTRGLPRTCAVALVALIALALCLASGAAAAQKTKLVLLGTSGGPTVYAARSEPASLILVDGRPYLVDVGYGAVRRLVEAGINPADVGAVFITHQHLDHNGDLPALLSYQWAGGRASPTAVFGPLGTEQLVKAAADFLTVPAQAFGPQMPLAQKPEAIMRPREITQAGLVYKDKWVAVTAAENSHYVVRNTLAGDWRDKSFSYRFKTSDRTIVFTGDTGPSEAVTKLARGADILVSEVIDLDGISRLLRAARGPDGAPLPEADYRTFMDHMEREHLPAEELGKMAAKAKVKMVVLTHLVVAGENGEATADALVAQVRKHYSGPVAAGKDLDTF